MGLLRLVIGGQPLPTAALVLRFCLGAGSTSNPDTMADDLINMEDANISSIDDFLTGGPPIDGIAL